MPNFKGFSSVAQLVSGAISVDLGSIAAAAVEEVSVTVPGSTPDMHFIVTAPSLDTGLVIGGGPICTTAGTVKVRVGNLTAAPIDAAAQNFYFLGL